MKSRKIPLKTTGRFPKLFLDYIAGTDTLTPFYHRIPAINNFADQIADKKFSTEQRNTLYNALKAQYDGTTITNATQQNIDALKESNTFTITTGHQLNIFTGPLYFIYKIITIINACKALKATHPQHDFVPVYWMASEDHDFEEINHFRLDGKKYQWKTDQQGAVGHFNPASIAPLLASIPGLPEFFKVAYLENSTLAAATRSYVNELFGEYGLVILDGDDRKLKTTFSPVITDDIFNHTANDLVEKQSKLLENVGYKTQVFPRTINFFYLHENGRSRIVEEDNRYQVLDTALSFSAEEIKKMIACEPERFSPNVVLRPLYQEMILPNLAYVGGPGELAYWLQLKPVFNHYDTIFPILLPRNFAMIVPAIISKKWRKTGLADDDSYLPKPDVLKKVVEHHTKHNMHLNGKKEALTTLFASIKTQATAIDPTLAPHVAAQHTRAIHQLEVIEKKMIRAEKRNHADKIRQAEEVLNFLFPNGGLQERTNNFLNFYRHNPAFIHQLIAKFDPFDYRFNVLTDDD